MVGEVFRHPVPAKIDARGLRIDLLDAGTLAVADLGNSESRRWLTKNV